MGQSQCTIMVDGYRCIFVEDHGGEHYAPQDSLDHSDAIRIRILRDRCACLEAQREETSSLLTLLLGVLREVAKCYRCPSCAASGNSAARLLQTHGIGSGDAWGGVK